MVDAGFKALVAATLRGAGALRGGACPVHGNGNVRDTEGAVITDAIRPPLPQ